MNARASLLLAVVYPAVEIAAADYALIQRVPFFSSAAAAHYYLAQGKPVYTVGRRRMCLGEIQNGYTVEPVIDSL